MNNKPIYVAFINKKLESEFESLKEGKLWKYDLPNGWRIIYTVKTDEVMILNLILEWFDHKEYERRFNY